MPGRVILDPKKPQHVAIVMDGNGRWAENQGLPRIQGHQAGVEPVRKMIRCCLQHQIPYLSLFAFSSENWSRPSEEVNFLMELFLENLKKELPELHKNGVKMRFTGDRSVLKTNIQAQMAEAETVTGTNQQLVLNLVVNYGGKWDIVTAAKKMANAVQKGALKLESITENDFDQFLDTNGLPDPDLLIRTSGELRISNFYLWQLAYTELYFAEVNWPDFDESAFELALAAYARRKRRFGDITNQ